MRDQQSTPTMTTAITPAVYSDDNTPIAIDRLGYDSLTFALMIGVGGISFTGTNRIDFIVEHSDDGATWQAVGVKDIIGPAPDVNGIVRSQRTAHAAATVDRIGYVDGLSGDKRFVRLRADFNGTHGTGTPIAAVAILGKPRTAPAA